MKEKIIATLPEKAVIENARNYGGEKELLIAFSVVCIAPRSRELREVICARVYGSRRGNRRVCSIWISDRASGRYLTGCGSASGYGYHRESDALEGAIRSAGIRLSEAIAGRGQIAMSRALAAIVEALGYRDYIVVDH